MAVFAKTGVADLLLGEHRGVFQAGELVTISRAPGRLDVMGGIADYSGASVLEQPLAEATVCGVQLRHDGNVRIVSSALDHQGGFAPDVTVPLASLVPQRTGSPYASVRDAFPRSSPRHWAAYGLGAFTVLLAESVVRSFPRGATIAIRSDIPLGAGVSSSAALEVAVMSALAASYQLDISGMRLAALCQKVENLVVGAPCGIMDQVTSVLGQTGKLLCLKCQPHEVRGFTQLPDGLRFVGFNTGVKHSIGGMRYANARIGAFMGQRIIQHLSMGKSGQDATRGFLANVTVPEFREKWAALLPVSLTGAEFLGAYGHTNDHVAQIDPDAMYKVRSRAEHPVYENHRVEQLISLLDQEEREVNQFPAARAGTLMYASHWSYGQRCGLGSRETDVVVRLVREMGPEAGFFGAKITGGGAGGTVAILCGSDTDAGLSFLAERYSRICKRVPRLFLESGPGAEEWGTATVRL